MKELLIHFLGGFTRIEYIDITAYANGQTLIYARQIEDLKDLLKKEQEDNKYLRDLIFKDKGVTHEANAVWQQQLNPIQFSRPSWPRIKDKLERQDREKLEAQKQANATEKYWEDKMTQELNEEAEKIVGRNYDTD